MENVIKTRSYLCFDRERLGLKNCVIRSIKASSLQFLNLIRENSQEVNWDEVFHFLQFSCRPGLSLADLGLSDEMMIKGCGPGSGFYLTGERFTLLHMMELAGSHRAPLVPPSTPEHQDCYHVNLNWGLCYLWCCTTTLWHRASQGQGHIGKQSD